MRFTFNPAGTMLIAVALSALSALSAEAASSEFSASATIDISVTVQAKTCTPSWADKDTNVDFGQVSLKNVGNVAGQVAVTKPFTLSLSECEAAISKVTVTASGTPDPDQPRFFANSGAAKGMAVELLNADTDETIGNGESAVFTVADSAVQMNFLAELVSTGAAGAAGDFSSNVTLNMSYE